MLWAAASREPRYSFREIVAKILLIESQRVNAPSYAPILEKKGFEVIRACTMHTALKILRENKPDAVILDAASMRTSGARMSRTLRAKLKGEPLLLITPEGSLPSMNGAASLVLEKPITPRKLTNRLRRLLPGKDEDAIVAGPIRLNLAKRTVRCNGRQTRLTPQLVSLLKLLIDHKGKVVTRIEIMQHVWRTSYMGDTRTLDVHISWLRKAIEPDTQFPKFIKTVRGSGYRLDI